MTQPERRDFLNTEEVATELGVSPMRVRQLLTEGELPQPTKLGARAYMWHRADIAAVKSRRAGEPSSQASGVLASPPQRLRRVADAVLDVPVHFGETSPLHVRIWAGAALEGQRTVVLLGQLRYGAAVQVHLEQIVKEVAPLLPADPREAVWFSYLPGDDQQAQEVDNLIWHLTSEDEPASGGRMWHLFRRAGRRLTRRDEAPRFLRPASLPEVERIVGSPIEAYPGPAYTPTTIETWRRTGRTVPVPHDEIDHDSLISAARTLAAAQAAARDSQRTSAAGNAVHLLVDDVRERHTWIDRQPWDDGTKPPFGREPGPEWPTTWAARLIKPRITAEDRQLLDAHPERFDIPREPTEHGALHELLDQLRRWSCEVDAYSDQHDEELHAAIERAARLLAFYLGVYDKAFQENDHPDNTARFYEVVGQWDRAYLAQLADADLTEHPRSHRVLAERLRRQITDPALLRWGTDPAGRLVAHYLGDPDQPWSELYAVEWPLRPPAEPIPAGTHIVADGERGDRPAYLAYPGGRVEPLPAEPSNVLGGWNFGYSGGGPGALESAIISAFVRADGVERDAMPRAWINDQVEYATNGDTLKVAVDELRRRYRA